LNSPVKCLGCEKHKPLNQLNHLCDDCDKLQELVYIHQQPIAIEVPPTKVIEAPSAVPKAVREPRKPRMKNKSKTKGKDGKTAGKNNPGKAGKGRGRGNVVPPKNVGKIIRNVPTKPVAE